MNYNYKSNGIELTEDEFDILQTGSNSIKIKRFTWKNASNISVQVITYGATITSIKLPDKNGAIDDVVMGYNNIQGYLNPLNPYFGACIGRVANRIGYGKITIENVEYQVSKNLGKHQLHGGFKGFDKVVWDYYAFKDTLVLSYHSADCEEGFPGDLVVNVTFQLTNTNEFKMLFSTTTTKPTFVNLTNHSYFNLAGDSKGSDELFKHVVSINSDQITDIDKDSIPTGKLLNVADTAFDLRIPKLLGDVIYRIPGSDGYDHNFCLSKGVDQEDSFVARVVHPPTGRVLEVYSNQPGVQFYTSNFIPEDPKKVAGNEKKPDVITGKNGNYYKHGAFCLETQNYPDAINNPNFPKAVLYPGEIYKHTLIYKFFLKP